MGLASFSTVSAAARAPYRTSELGARLESARQSIEGRFLEAGDVLSRAIDGVGSLITSLDRIRNNLDAETVSTTTTDLAKAADTLKSLPADLDDRRGRVGELVKVGDSLAGFIEEMRQHLAYLRVFAINIKITSGGIAAAGPEFAIFAQEIYDCIEMGRSQLDAFNADLISLDTSLRIALTQENDLGRACMALLPAVPDALTASASAIAEHHAKISSVALSVASIARDVQKKVGGGLAALQIGDITRQRIEHVQAGLDYLKDLDEALSADQRLRASAFVHRLLAAQMASTAEDFHRDVSRIGHNVVGMAADASEILRLRDLVFGQDEGAGNGFLRGLEHNVSQALGLVDNMKAGEQSAENIGRSAVQAARELSERIAGIQNMRADVQMMALNTTLKCSRIGETGKPLGVIAVELRQHAIHLEKSAAHTLTALEGLFSAAESLGRGAEHDNPNEGKAAEAAGMLSEAVARIGKAGDGIEHDLSAVARQGSDVVDMLRHASARFDFQKQIGSILDEAAADLMGSASEDDIQTDDIAAAIRPLLAKLAKQYTMSQERDVHRAMTEQLGEDAPAPVAVTEDRAEDPEDVLF